MDNNKQILLDSIKDVYNRLENYLRSNSTSIDDIYCNNQMLYIRELYDNLCN